MIQALQSPPSPTSVAMSRLALPENTKCQPASPIDNKQLNEKAIRNRMVKHLQHRLDLQQQREGVSTYKAARRLEHLLFKSSHDLQEYQDPSTLNDRLRSILATQLCRRTLRKKETNTPQQTRKDALIQAMGSTETYYQAKALVETIQQCKFKKVSEMKPCAGSSGACSFIPKKNEFQRDTPFPPAIRNLFFHTPLIQAFAKTPVSRLSSLNWSHMIAQAQQHLQDFEAYERQAKL